MTKTLSRALAFATVAFTACAGNAPEPTTTKDQPPVEDLVRSSARAKAVFVGEVVAIDYRLSEPDADGRVVPFHFVTWRVDRAIRGIEQGATWTGRFAGGPFGDGRTLWVSEVPEVELGQRALLLADDGDAGACALVGCRNGMLLVSDAHGRKIDDAALDRVIDALDDGPATARARSVDPDARFAFVMPTAGSPKARARVSAPQPSTATSPELDALARNGRNPVIR